MKRILQLIAVSLAMVLIMSACSLYSEEPATPATGGSAAQTTTDAVTTSGSAAQTAAEAGAASESEPAEAGGVTVADRPLIAKWPEFAADRSAKFLCFEMGWTGPEKDKDFVAPELARRTGFYLDYESQTVTTDEDLQAKLNLMMSSGQVPDIYFGPADNFYRDVCKRLGEAGLIWNYAPYIKDYPDIYELMKPELLRHYDTEKKAIYFIPTQNGRGFDALSGTHSGDPYVRRDFLEALGMKHPTTPEELYDYLAGCATLPDVNGKPIIPMSMDEGLRSVESILNLFWPLPRMVGGGWGFDPNNNDEFYNHFFTNSEYLIRGAKYVNRLYREGLLDREVLTIKRDQFMEKVASGRVGSAFMPMWDMTTWSDQAKEIVPELFYTATPDIYDKANGLPLYPDSKWTNWVGYWSSLIVSKRLDESAFRHFLAMLDYLTTTEGQVLVQAGIEGISFDYDAEGKYHYREDFLAKTDNMDWNKAASYGVFYYQQVVNNYPAFKDVEGMPNELLREEHMAGYLQREERRSRYDPDMMPYKSQFRTEGELEITLMPAINEAKFLFFANILKASNEDEVEKVVADWAKTCKDLGIDQVIEEMIASMENLVVPTDLDY